MLTINNTNLEPNQRWFVKLIASSHITVQVYQSKADADTGVSVVGAGQTNGFGSNLEVTLAQVAPSPVISNYNPAFNWHFIVSGQEDDPEKIYKLGPFSDLPAESHSIYRNSDIIIYKATALIDEHTHLDRRVTIQMPRIELGLFSCESVRLDSEELGRDWLLTCRDVSFGFTQDEMTQTIVASKFEGITR